MIDGNHLVALLATAHSREFAALTPLHGVVLLVFALVAWTLVVVGRDARRRGADAELDRWLGGTALAIWISLVVYWFVPARFSIGISFPIHLCDLANLIAALAFLTKNRFWRVMLFYWAFALCTQAFITPTVEDGPRSIWFWLFWAYHFAIVGLAIVDVAVRDFIVTWRDFRTATLATFAWCMSVFLLNIPLHTNYGYVGERESATTTLISTLGPWPWRVAILGMIVVFAFALITLTAQVVRAAAGRRPSRAPFQTPAS